MTWNGPEIVKAAIDVTADAMGEIGEKAANESRKELYPGHGYITGTLWRSINYTVKTKAQKATLSLSSDAKSPQGHYYAIWVHEGHHSFPGYHFFTRGMMRTIPAIPAILER